MKEKPNLSISIVDELPEVGQEGILYLVPSEDPELENAYDEYVWLPESETFEMVGSTAIDLSNMVTTDTAQTITGEKTFTADITAQGDIDATGDLITAGKVQIGANGYDIKKDSSNLVIEADGNPIKVRGNLIPNTGATYTLGGSSNQWKTLYLSHYLDFGNNAMVHKDESNRICITNGSDDKIKVGAAEVICKDNFSPDQDANYSLGRSALRWGTLNVTNVANDYSALQLKGKSGMTITCDNGSAVKPSTNGQIDLGGSTAKWATVYANYISDGTNTVAAGSLVARPDYANPDVFESGTLDSNGEGTIDMTQTGIPSDGLYMFTYGNAQCFLSLTSTMIQNASSYPIRCTCPVLKIVGQDIEGHTGNLKISRAADLLTLKVASTVNGSASAGFQWQLIKVM